MKTQVQGFLIGLCLFTTLPLQLSICIGQGSAFTYQGLLADNGTLANGQYDFEFALLDGANGNALAFLLRAPVVVSNGLFASALDFGGGMFDGSPRWLRLAVRPYGSGITRAVLSPTQAITPAPYAIHSADGGTPPGTINAYMGTNAPPGWLLCNGSAVSRNQYAQLFGVIGTANGSGDGVLTFNLPDLRGAFLRGLDGTAGVDPDKASRVAAKPGGSSGNALGSLQMDEFKSHTHANGNFFRLLQVTGANTVTATDSIGIEPDVVNSAPMTAAGGNETRPRNIYVNYIIKY